MRVSAYFFCPGYDLGAKPALCSNLTAKCSTNAQGAWHTEVLWIPLGSERC